MIVLCLFPSVFSFVSPSSLLFAPLTGSFVLSSLFFLQLVGCRLFLGSRPRAAPQTSGGCLQSSAVLLLGPFLGGPRIWPGLGAPPRLLAFAWVLPSEKESTCILPFVRPSVHVITCSSFMWLEIHASTEAFTCFF